MHIFCENIFTRSFVYISRFIAYFIYGTFNVYACKR